MQVSIRFETEIFRSWGFPKPIECKCIHQYIAFRYKVFVTAQLFGDERCLKSSSIAIEITFKNCALGQSVMISLEPVELYGTFWRDISLRCSSLQWQLVRSKIHINHNHGVGKEYLRGTLFCLIAMRNLCYQAAEFLNVSLQTVRPQVGKYSGEVKRKREKKRNPKSFPER